MMLSQPLSTHRSSSLPRLTALSLSNYHHALHVVVVQGKLSPNEAPQSCMKCTVDEKRPEGCPEGGTCSQ